MRVQYNVTKASEQGYRNALHGNLGIYHLQTGAGIGSFLSKLLKKAIPIGKSLLHYGYEAIKPELQKVAVKGIEYAANKGSRYLKNVEKTAYKKIGVKRKRDALS